MSTLRQFNSIILKIRQNILINDTSRCYWQLHSVPKVSPQVEKWNKTISQASDLMSNNSVAKGLAPFLSKSDQVTKLLNPIFGTRHPLLQESISLFYEARNIFQVYSLIALLFAKAVGHARDSSHYEEAMSTRGISESQRKLADAIELFNAHFRTHYNVMNLNSTKDGSINNTLKSGNGLTVLLGDYLAANALCVLAAMKNQQVLGLMSLAEGDYSEAIFSGSFDLNGNMIPDPHSPFSVWEKITSMTNASLLSRGCEGMMILAGHNNIIQENARNFGKYIALAIKVNKDIEDFSQLSTHFSGTPFTLELAPVILHLQTDHELLEWISKNVENDVANLDFKKIHYVVKNGRGMEKSRELLTSYINKARESMPNMESSLATNLLLDLLQSLKE